MNMEKIVVVTGGTSGIGLAAVDELVKCGCRVYEISRRDAGVNKSAVHISADVTDEEKIRATIEQIVADEGRIDVVINNAGFGISGAIEFTPFEVAKQQFDVIFFGTVNVNQAVLPFMRKNGGGRIINISSVAAPVPIPFQAYYSASKAAIKSYTMALANEVKSFGIEVCTILPGDIKTGFTAARKKIIAGDEEYSGKISRSVSVMEHDEQNGMSPKVIGRYIAKITMKKRIGPQYTVGFKYKFFVFYSNMI